MILFANILVFMHIAAAAAWFGMALRVTSHARVASHVGGSAAAAIGKETQKGISLMGVFLVLAFLFGLVALFIRGGFGAYGPEYHTSILLIVILIGIHYLLVRPLWDRFTNAVTSDNGRDATKLRKRLGMFVGVGHLLWIVVLFLMLWRQYFSGFVG